jgi:putative SOS response-associated peptidase YedK
MCGRVVQRSPLQDVVDYFGGVLVHEGLVIPPRFNLAPSQNILALRAGRRQPEALMLHWGLIPSWAKDPSIGSRMINARAETAADKPAYRDCFRRRRCIVPVDGFYEWQKQGRGKQPYYIHGREGRPLALAGLWDRWSGEGQVIESCTILTTTPNSLMHPLHDRMPVILSKEDVSRWLDPQSQPEGLRELLRPSPPERLEAYPVGVRINSPVNDDPQCLSPQSGEATLWGKGA